MPRKRENALIKSERRFGLALVTPSFFLVFSIIIFPILFSLYISFHSWNWKRPQTIGRFIGLTNYINAITNKFFVDSLRTTFIFAFSTVFLTFIMAMAIALVLNTDFRGRGVVRSILLIPWAIPAVSNAVLWQWAFDADYGWINGILRSLHLISEPIQWLSRGDLALGCVIFASVWKGVPFTAIVLLAALQTVPKALTEAARIDGAGRWGVFKNVTLPWISTSILVVNILNTVWTFQSFALIYNLTQGGPGTATQVLPYFIWIEAFRWMDAGLGSATAFVLMAIIFVLTAVYFKLFYRGGGEYR
ncbi:MAG: sugar ABC transporter permease [Thermoprotei archaeon]|nr:MAG: sugar ABC transporter permease [Thermoprotei archaeon]